MPHILPSDKKSTYPTQLQGVVSSNRKKDIAVEMLSSIFLNSLSVGLAVTGNVASAEISNKIHGSNKYNLGHIAVDTAIGAGILGTFAILVGSLYVKNYPTLANLSRNRATVGCLLQVALATLIINAASILIGTAVNNRATTNYLHILGLGLGGGAIVFGMLMVLGEIANRLAWKKEAATPIIGVETGGRPSVAEQSAVESTAQSSEAAPLLGATHAPVVVPADINVEKRIHFRQSPLVEACFPSQPTSRHIIN